MKILLSTGIFYKVATLAETEKHVRDLGYDGVELNLPPRNRPTVETHRDVDYDALQHCMAVHVPGDTYDRERFTRALVDAVAIAERVGASVVNIHPAPLSLGGRAHVVWGVEEIQRVQANTSVTIVYEVLVDPEGIADERYEKFVRDQAYLSVGDWVADVKAYDLPATLDTCHIGTWKIPPASVIPKLGQNLRHVHFSDYSEARKIEHLVPGEGDVQLEEFLKALAVSHPDVTLTVELHPVNTLDEAVAQAKSSIEFIKGVV